MRLFLLTALTMVAFAANSILNRMALAGDLIGPSAFAAIRVAAGVAVLVALASLRGQMRLGGPRRWVGALSLTLYVLGFSFAYVSLDAGIGALVLFGGVQVTMFAGAVLAREDIPPLRWVGAAVALAGLAVLFWPAPGARPDPAGLALMAAAAMGWGIYSLHGRGSAAPLGDTAANFALALPLALATLLLVPDGQSVTGPGIALAVLSGGVTSGLGYALWYSVLPALGATRAAVAQLTVPIIAIAAGVALLAETVTSMTAIAALLVLGGVALSIRR